MQRPPGHSFSHGKSHPEAAALLLLLFLTRIPKEFLIPIPRTQTPPCHPHHAPTWCGPARCHHCQGPVCRRKETSPSWKARVGMKFDVC